MQSMKAVESCGLDGRGVGANAAESLPSGQEKVSGHITGPVPQPAISQQWEAIRAIFA